MFVIKHRPSGMYWMATDPTPRAGPAFASAWILDPAQARSFCSEQDAFDAAMAECTADIQDLEIIELPARVEAAAS